MDSKSSASASAPPPSAFHPETLAAEPPRRRGTAAKRKAAAAAAAAAASFAPSKRLAKERNPFNSPPLLHNGPLTRARQSPLKLAAASAATETTTPPHLAGSAAASGGGGGGAGISGGGDVIRLDEEEPPAEEPPLVDEEFEVVRSRGTGVHVVPTFAGWFSWKEIHPIEKQMLPSFFNGKSEKRTLEIYLGIRNFIMRKFHADPQVQVEAKDLAELPIGEMDARQEVMEFLDHWGLINFHPFPPVGTEEESKNNADGEEKASLLEKLYQFETVQSYLVSVPKKVEVSAVTPVPSLLPELPIVEDLITPIEPSVEYHCNSCSADCSRKRFHCQTQADFDLCTECYSEGKFDAGMSRADFILMESAEVPGAGGTSWTDQETLLLLEALELFGANWSEIAEHVATKTKAQCMLHFLQMPIEDSFLDGDDVNQTIQETAEHTSAEKDTADATVPEKMEVEDKAEEKETSEAKAPGKTEGDCAEGKTETDNQNVDETKEAKNSSDLDPVTSSNTDPTEKESSADIDTSGETASNVAIDVLKSAFRAVGHFAEEGDLGSFTDAGNPVMALAAFLAGLVQHDNAFTSYRGSLKAMSEVSPALQLATRHCFILEDAPNDLKDPVDNVSSTTKVGAEHQKDEDDTSNSNDTEKNTGRNTKEENALSAVKENNPSTSSKDHQELSNMKESCDKGLTVEPKSNSTKDSGDPMAIGEKSTADNTKDVHDSTLPSVTRPNNTKELTSLASQEVIGSTKKEASDPKLVSEDKPSCGKESGDDSSPQSMVELGKTEDTVANITAVKEHDPRQVSGMGPTLENGEKTEHSNHKEVAVNDDKSSKPTDNNDDYTIHRLKRAAATALSAAAVKAKLLAEQEEDQIRQLVALVIEKQFHKMEAKLALFTDVENMVLRAREQIDRTRQRLLHERSQIIAARLGLPVPPSFRPNPSSVPMNRLPAGYGVPGSKPLNAMPERPPAMRRP